MKKGLIGSLMVQRGLLTAAQLEQAQAIQRQSRGQLDEILIGTGMLTESALQSCLAEISACPFYDLAALEAFVIEDSLLEAVNYRTAMTHLLLPLRMDVEADTLFVAAQAPLSRDVKAGLLRNVEVTKLEVGLCTRDDLLEGIRFHYGSNLASRATQKSPAVGPDREAGSYEEINEFALQREGFCPTCGAPAAGAEPCARCGRSLDAFDPYVDRIFGGRWKLTRLLSQGGMGLIYQALDLETGKSAAVKLLRNQFRSSSVEIQRFNTEAKILQRLKHPQIVSTHEFGFQEKLGFYLAMELLEGEDLYEYQFQLTLPTTLLCEIFAQVCDAMAYAHDQGIIHRDLKPENIFLLGGIEQFQGVKIFDFGIAKLLEGHRHLTQPGVVMGTPEYIAPEQARNGPVDHRTDIYALSVIMYEFLSGERLFEAENAYAYLMKHVYAPVVPLSVRARRSIPLALEQLIMSGLAKDPARRVPSMEAFRDGLYQVIAELEELDDLAASGELHEGHVAAVMSPARSATPTRSLSPGAGEGALADTQQAPTPSCAQGRVPTRAIYGQVSGAQEAVSPALSVSRRASQMMAEGAAGLMDMVSRVPLPAHASAYAGAPRPFAASVPSQAPTYYWDGEDSQAPEDDPAAAPTVPDALPCMIYDHATMPIQAMPPEPRSARWWIGVSFGVTLLCGALILALLNA